MHFYSVLITLYLVNSKGGPLRDSNKPKQSEIKNIS